MARSSYIYICFNHADELLGAWTSKRDLKAYVKDSLLCHRDYWVSQILWVPDGLGAGCEAYRSKDVTKDFIGANRNPL